MLRKFVVAVHGMASFEVIEADDDSADQFAAQADQQQEDPLWGPWGPAARAARVQRARQSRSVDWYAVRQAGREEVSSPPSDQGSWWDDDRWTP